MVLSIILSLLRALRGIDSSPTERDEKSIRALIRAQIDFCQMPDFLSEKNKIIIIKK